MVSVVIPVRNERDRIEECLAALARQTYGGDAIEIVIAEGGSSDGTRELLSSLAAREPKLLLVPSPSGRTPAALNLAIGASSGDVICRMDAHAVPAQDYIERCVEVLKSSGAWAVGGRMVKIGLSPFGHAVALASSSRFGVGDSSFHYATQPQAVDSVYLGCWPRTVFDIVGLFDEELVRNQDDELSYRIRSAGGTIWFDPTIAVIYHPRESFKALFGQHRQYGFWKIRVFQKHAGAIRPRHLVPGVLVGVIAIMPLGLVFRPFLLSGIAAGGAYLAAASLAATTIRRREPRARFGHLLSAFAAMHFGYGLGLWQGAVRWGVAPLLRRRGR